MAKQTGREYGVKSTYRRVSRLTGYFLAAAALAACATTWTNPTKSPDEARVDYKSCASEAEETALARASTQRVDYGRTSPVQPGMNRGENPMQLVDRMQTENTYERDFESCMRSKGYSQD
jgi:hypothetical protein